MATTMALRANMLTVWVLYRDLEISGRTKAARQKSHLSREQKKNVPVYSLPRSSRNTCAHNVRSNYKIIVLKGKIALDTELWGFTEGSLGFNCRML
ncbi:hypothetical protein EK904_002620 [Melospiza melodia maxima]|nr:hypothetical protein EK904_002620 [Melospiza melodia maxima]